MRGKTQKLRRIGRPRGPTNQDGREQLLDTALTLFAEQGIAATTVADIASTANVTPAMVHYYFKNRERLLDAVVEERLQRFISYVWDPVVECKDDPLIMLTAVVCRIIEASNLMPNVPSLWVQEVLSEGGLLRERVLKRVPGDKLKHIADCISIAQRRGVVHTEIDSRLIILSVVGLTMIPLAAARIWQRLPGVETLNKDTLARHVTALLTYGLSKPRRKCS